MTNHPHRSRITILPLDTSYRKWHYRNMCDGIARQGCWTPEALTEDGLLVRANYTGMLVIYTGQCIKGVDGAKAEAALRAYRATV